MVPLDYYPSRTMQKDEIHWLLHSAAASNFNMIRIWGGGLYLEDSFYDEAAELGIMIW